MLDNEIGCYLSHYRLYERIVRDRICVALILEDDVEIDLSLPRILQSLIDETSLPWLAIRLQSSRGKILDPKNIKWLGRKIRSFEDWGVYRLNTHVLGFGGYLITYEGAQRMLNYGRKAFMPIDQTMDRFWENGIISYIVRPFPIRHNQPFKTRIGGRPAGRHRAQGLGLRALRRWQRFLDSVQKRLFVLTRRYKTLD